MSGKIRGHYRIDSTGRVTPLADVNAAMKPFSIPLNYLHDRTANRPSRLIKISLLGFTLLAVGVSGILELPQIERSMIAAQSMRIASAKSAFFRTHPDFRSHMLNNRTAEN